MNDVSADGKKVWIEALRSVPSLTIRVVQNCFAERSTTASSQMAGLSPRAHMAALRADRALAMRWAFGSVVADIARVMVQFPFVGCSVREKKKPAGKRRDHSGPDPGKTVNTESWSGPRR